MRQSTSRLPITSWDFRRSKNCIRILCTTFWFVDDDDVSRSRTIVSTECCAWISPWASVTEYFVGAVHKTTTATGINSKKYKSIYLYNERRNHRDCKALVLERKLLDRLEYEWSRLAAPRYNLSYQDRMIMHWWNNRKASEKHSWSNVLVRT